MITGAMLPSTALSSDGPKNLYNAVSAAAAPKSSRYGVHSRDERRTLRRPGALQIKDGGA